MSTLGQLKQQEALRNYIIAEYPNYRQRQPRIEELKIKENLRILEEVAKRIFPKVNVSGQGYFTLITEIMVGYRVMFSGKKHEEPIPAYFEPRQIPPINKTLAAYLDAYNDRHTAFDHADTLQSKLRERLKYKLRMRHLKIETELEKFLRKKKTHPFFSQALKEITSEVGKGYGRKKRQLRSILSPSKRVGRIKIPKCLEYLDRYSSSRYRNLMTYLCPDLPKQLNP